MSENLLEYYRASNGATKKKIPGCIFAEKLVLVKGKAATPERTFDDTNFFKMVPKPYQYSKENRDDEHF